MIKRGLEIDVDWGKNVQGFVEQQEELNKIYDLTKSQTLVYPEYYLKPFHAYDEGNLSWPAAYIQHISVINMRYVICYSYSDTP